MLFFTNHKRKRVLVLWYPVDVNLGDYYILKTVGGYLDAWGYDYIDLDVGLPYEVIAKYARKCDFLWFAGGGIIERGIPDIISNFEKFHKKSKQIEYGITGLSIGEFNYDYRESDISYWVKNSTFFYTRDDYSASELNRISKTEIVKQSIDVVFAYDIEREILDNNRSYQLGVNFRNLPYVDLTGEFQWEKWNASIEKLNKTVIGIPDQFDFSEYVSFMVDKDYAPEKALRYILKSDVILAMRFHVILFAARMGKIPIAINYCPKVKRLAEQLGIQDLLLEINGYDKLSSVYNMTESARDNYDGIIKKSVFCCEKQAKEMFDTIKKEFEKKV